MIRVVLDKRELEAIRLIADRRQAIKESYGIADGKQHQEATGKDVHYLGFAAEYAVAKWLQIQPDTTISPRGHRGRSLCYEGKWINTQYNANPNGELRYFPNRVPKVDAMILITGNPQIGSLNLVGWITAGSFLASYVTVQYGKHGDRWVFYQSALHPMRDFKRWAAGQPEPGEEEDDAPQQLRLFGT